MELAARIGTMARRGEPLPYDAEVEWISSNGNQFINTGLLIRNTATTRLSISFAVQFDNVSSNIRYGGWIDQSSSNWSQLYFNLDAAGLGVEIFKGAIVFLRAEQVRANTRYDIVVDTYNRIYTCNGNYAYGANPNIGESSFPFYIFARNGYNQTATNNFSGKFYKFEYAENGSVIQDLTPVRFTNENGVSESAMYNRLGVGGMNPDGSLRDDGLYRNRGTGAFGWKEKNGVIVPPQ